jgi:Gp157 protein
MTLPLYDLDPAYASLTDLPLQPEGDEDQTAMDERLTAVQDDVGSKLLALAKVVLTLEAEADVLETHARDLVGRASVRRRRVHWLKRWMQLQMEADGVTKLKDAFVTLWLQQSPASIDVVDETNVPAAFKRVTLKLHLSQVPPGLLGLVQTCDVDRAGLQALLKSTGELPPGLAYRQGERHLRIR